MNCGLCGHEASTHQVVATKKYFNCEHCSLVFLDPQSYLSSNDERAQYELHQNNSFDLNYRKFLHPAFEAVLKYSLAGGCGLDFGCGPGPTLSVMLEEAGFKMNIFDKFFFPDQRVLAESYDFVTCTEVIEHVAELESFLQKIMSLMHPGGLMVVMTRILQDETDFATWHYRIDPTHISFLRPQTVQFIAQRFELDLLHLTGQLFVLKKRQ